MHDIKAHVCREIGIAELIALQKLHPIKQFTTCADVQLAAPSLMAFKCAPSGLTERNTGEQAVIYGLAYLSPRLQRCSTFSLRSRTHDVAKSTLLCVIFIVIFGTDFLTGASGDKACYASDLLRQTDHI